VTCSIDFVTELPKREFVSSFWCTSVSKIVTKSAKAHHPCKCRLDGKKGSPKA
jgi:hypothetical protein